MLTLTTAEPSQPMEAQSRLQYSSSTQTCNNRVQFELKSKPGMFLMLKELNHSIADVDNNATSLPMNVTANQTIVREYVLVVDYPSEPYLTEWEKSTTSGALVQIVDENTTCAISFDSNGKVAGPCNLSAVDSITLKLVRDYYKGATFRSIN